MLLGLFKNIDWCVSITLVFLENPTWVQQYFWRVRATWVKKWLRLELFLICKVEVSPCWQQKKLREFCESNGILVVGYSPLGSIGTFYGTNRVMECQVLKEIAKAKDKTVAQVALRWGYEQGIGVVVKSYNKERMKQNLQIFDWSLSDDERRNIGEITQSRACLGKDYTSPYGPYKTIEELWDEELL